MTSVADLLPQPAFVSRLVPDGDDWQVVRAAADEPILTAFDYAATRGDGAFEAMQVLDGVANKPERHLERMARSLQMLAIIGPSYAAWKSLIADLIEQWPAGIEGVLKLVISRGQEGGPIDQPPTVYGTIAPIDDTLLNQRRHGINVISLTFGMPADLRAASPWLLGGTKYLSYAVNMAAKREAAHRGADDVIFTSLEDEVLEGPNATVVWKDGSSLLTTPASTGILRGTTQELIFSRLAGRGLEHHVAEISLSDLLTTEAVWMTSSTRGVAAIRTIDGQPIAQDPETTTLLQELSGLPILS